MTDRFLDKAYGVTGPEETQALYDAWAKSYEDEVAENGYATPGRCAEALFSVMPEPHAPVLDFGCGTGLSGLALRMAGFEVIDGMDISAEMLARAQEKSIYRSTQAIAPGHADLCTPGDYAAITAIGVIGAGAAPITVFDDIMNCLGRGGYFAFSFNDHAVADPVNEGKLNEYLDTGAAQLLVREYGPHLPGIGLKSYVYVIRKS